MHIERMNCTQFVLFVLISFMGTFTASCGVHRDISNKHAISLARVTNDSQDVSLGEIGITKLATRDKKSVFELFWRLNTEAVLHLQGS